MRAWFSFAFLCLAILIPIGVWKLYSSFYVVIGVPVLIVSGLYLALHSWISGTKKVFSAILFFIHLIIAIGIAYYYIEFAYSYHRGWN